MEKQIGDSAQAELTNDPAKDNDLLSARSSSSARTPLAVSSGKRPPAETKESIRIRSFVIFSFWAVVVFFGLPTWWWTTSIYRARLPLQEMHEWADGKVESLEVLLTAASTFANPGS